MKKVTIPFMAQATVVRFIEVEVPDDADEQSQRDTADAVMSQGEDLTNATGEWKVSTVWGDSIVMDTERPITIGRVADDVEGALRITPE